MDGWKDGNAIVTLWHRICALIVIVIVIVMVMVIPLNTYLVMMMMCVFVCVCVCNIFRSYSVTLRSQWLSHVADAMGMCCCYLTK